MSPKVKSCRNFVIARCDALKTGRLAKVRAQTDESGCTLDVVNNFVLKKESLK